MVTFRSEADCSSAGRCASPAPRAALVALLLCGMLACTSTRPVADVDDARADLAPSLLDQGTGSGFDSCATTQPRPVGGSSRADVSSPPLVLADDRGWLLVWARTLSQYDAPQGGIWAVRPGQTPVRLAAVNTFVLRTMRLPAGFLLCWTSTESSPTDPFHVECGTIDGQLAFTGSTTRIDAYPDLVGFLELAGKPHALFRSAGQTPADLVPIDQTGRPAGSGVALSCSPVAWSEAGLACLIPSDPNCGSQFNEPPDCQYLLRLLRPDGTQVGTDAIVAPFGYYTNLINVHVAARKDGLLVSWIDNEGLHVRPVAYNGTIGAPTRVVVQDALYGRHSLAAVPGGYAVSWTENGSASSRLPKVAVFDPNGKLLQGPRWLGDSSEPQYQGPADFGSSGGGWAAAWSGAEGDGSAFRSTVLFRALGCSP